MTFECVCKTCDKKFRSQKKDSTICYDCALEHFTGGSAPEEGDFNSAALLSGEMSDAEAQSLQEDLESVDHSREEVYWNRMVEDYCEEPDDHRWDYFEERDKDE